MFIRKKVFELDGVKVTMAPLSNLQVEEHLAADDAITKGIRENPSAVQDLLKQREGLHRQIVENSIRRAANNDGDALIAALHEEAEHDTQLWASMVAFAMDLSGLRFVSAEQPPGEK